MKRTISVIIATIIIIQNVLFGITVYANDTTNDYIYKYSGVTHSNGYNVTCTLTVTQINGERFRGTFSAEGISIYSFTNKPISGNVVTEENLITFVFQVKFYNDRYYSNVYTTISPYEGTADCFCFGSWHLEDFKMTGEKQLQKEYSPSIDLANYDEDDMKLCMRFSKAAYSKKFSESVPDEIISIAKLKDFNTNGLISSNEHKGRKEENNISYTILPNFSKTSNSVDLYVILRGTTEEEWQGNMDITGEYYKYVRQHQSFFNGSEYLRNKINQYFDLNYKFYKDLNVNLHITGHSRGAAVANLYAKYVSDNRNLGTIDKNLFANKVVAYTFATPNVEKFHFAMTNYNNIFNFCFYEDFVPTIPLTMPTDGWDYWKYGYTYWVSLSDFKKEHFDSNIPLVNKNDVIEVHNTMTKWSSVEKYYKEPCYDFNNTFSVTAYNFFHDSFAKAMMPSKKSKAIGIYSLYADFKQFPDFVPLIIAAGKNISTIINAHNYTTYSEIISTYGSSCFSYCSYETYKDMFSSINYPEIQTKNVYSLNNNFISYNKNEIAYLSIFANQNDNLSILNWNLDGPSTWTGITWNENGNVESIDLSFKNLSGSLDLSNFGSLKKLDVTGNNLTSLNLDNCTSLEEIDCSFNKLTALNLSDCTNLTSVTCCYNYLDTHEGSTLYNKLDDLMFSDCYVNYYPQSVPDNATFDTTELNALKTFVNTNNNNTALNWLDDSGNIDTEKLQNNVLFEYDGSKYRVVVIDISDLDISGALDLTSLSLLQELYCENTKITTLNIKGCTKLENLKCDGCKLTSITLPSNANAKTSSLYDVSCEYNYLDTSIFTQDVIKYVEFKAGGEIQYKNQKGDSSALQAAVSYGESLEEEDYSKSSFAQLNEILCECKNYDYDNLYLTQADIDSLTADILTKIYNLKAFLNAKISAKNGIVKVFYDETEFEDNSLANSGGVIELPPDTDGFTVSDGSDTFSLLFGTTVTLTATPKEGYNFIGWYNSSSNRYISTENPYTFKATANADIKAVFASDGNATLTFLTPSNQVITTISKFPAEWAEVGTINDLLPDVPFKYGCKNGRWEYDEADVLSKLRSGENVNIVSTYDKGEFTVPSARKAEGKPALDLYYKYDDESGIGSFIMTTGFPENIKVESVGIAYYFKAADSFNPKDYILTLNNKVSTSKFGMDKLYDYYIMNMKNINDRNNWSVRGYVAYYDSNDNLQVEYSNQINIINNIADRSAVSNENPATQLPPDEI